MRLQPARSLFAALVAITVTAPIAHAQDADAGALTAVYGTSLDPRHVPYERSDKPALPPTPPPGRPAKIEFTPAAMAFSAAAGADWASTAWSLSHPTSHEDNPLIAWAGAPPAIIAAGAAIDTIGAYAWIKSTANHRKLQS